jgi:hypothetical protein
MSPALGAHEGILCTDLHEALFRHVGAPLADYVANLETGDPDEVVIIVVPQVIVGAGVLGFLHSHRTTCCASSVAAFTRIAIATVPFHIAAPEREVRWSLGKARTVGAPTNPAWELVRCRRYHKSCHPPEGV